MDGAEEVNVMFGADGQYAFRFTRGEEGRRGAPPPVKVHRSRGAPLEFSGNQLQFRTGENRRRHEFSLGTKPWPEN